MLSPLPGEPGKHGEPRIAVGKLVLMHTASNLSKTRQLQASPVHVGLQAEPDQFRFLGNCPPTPPTSQHFALSKK